MGYRGKREMKNLTVVRSSLNLICTLSVFGLIRFTLGVAYEVSKYGWGRWVTSWLMELGSYSAIAIVSGVAIYYLKLLKKDMDSN
jgi:hypothetical protein